MGIRSDIIRRNVRENLNKISMNLSNEIRSIKGNSLKGLIEAAKFIRRDMEATPPLIPVDLGNLRASFFIVSKLGATDHGFPEGNFKARQGPGKPNAEQAAEMTIQHNTIKSQHQAKATGYKTMDIVYLGFSANYAAYVHEKDDNKTRWKRPGSGAKFFEYALTRNVNNIMKIIGQNVVIGRRKR